MSQKICPVCHRMCVEEGAYALKIVHCTTCGQLFHKGCRSKATSCCGETQEAGVVFGEGAGVPDLEHRKDPYDKVNRARILETVFPIICGLLMWQVAVRYIPIPHILELLMVIVGWIVGVQIARGLVAILPGSTEKPKPIH